MRPVAYLAIWQARWPVCRAMDKWTRWSCYRRVEFTVKACKKAPDPVCQVRHMKIYPLIVRVPEVDI